MIYHFINYTLIIISSLKKVMTFPLNTYYIQPFNDWLMLEIKLIK